MTWGWPQWAMLVLLLGNVVATAAKTGDLTNTALSLSRNSIYALVMGAGGFWS